MTILIGTARRLFLSLFVTAFVAGGLAAQGRDWFVRAGAVGGDGSREQPFADPWQALERCEAGDSVHVAAGRYTGKLERGQWTVPFDDIRVLGGYSADWSSRDPWRHATELVHDRTSKNWPLAARFSVQGKGVVLDGLVLDMAEQNEYVDAGRTGRSPKSMEMPFPAIELQLPGTVRNCVAINTGAEAVVCVNGSTIENNLFVNVYQSAVRVRALPAAHEAARTPALVRGNTIAWSWCERAPGTGRFSGAGVTVAGPAVVADNLIAHCDNNGVFCSIDPSRVSVTGNVFSRNLWSNFKLLFDGRDVAVDDQELALLEECELKAWQGNAVGKPGLRFDAAWLDRASKRTAAVRGKVVMDDWNQLRRELGLGLVASGGAPASGIAPAYPLPAAFELMTPTDRQAKVGARILPLEVGWRTAATPAARATYAPSQLVDWARDAAAVDGQALELVVAPSGAANVTGIPAPYVPDEHLGVKLYDPTGNVFTTGFFRKGSSVQRVIEPASRLYQGVGKPQQLFVARGRACVVQGYPKSGFLVEELQPYVPAAVADERKVGRDWFVVAGAAAGDGSRDKPFRDPYQPLERCEAGDTIHVAGGDYFGKLKAGRWQVDCPDVAIVGGYGPDFATRDPWRYPTRLLCPAEFKGARGGYTLEGREMHDGLVLDGLVFDKRGNNRYAGNGDLEVAGSDTTEHVWLSRPRCVIRNCVFANGALGAVRVAPGQTIENNVFVNHNVHSVFVQPGHVDAPIVLRGNTILFTWEKLFGEGKGRPGNGIVLDGRIRARIEGNLVQFSDNDAIRLGAEPADVELVDNVFAQSLHSVVFLPAGPTFVDDRTFDRLGDLGWKKCEGNRLLLPDIPIDPQWFDVYLNRTAYVPGKVVMDEWNELRSLLGQPVLASGGRATQGFAPAFDGARALSLWPRNEQCRAGARRHDLPVAFTGGARATVEQHYDETTWEVARDAAGWNGLVGQRVQLVVALYGVGAEWTTPGVARETHSAWMVCGPGGVDGGGLPMRVYTAIGTRADRTLRQANPAGTGRPDATYRLRGIVRDRRQMIVEAVERED
ncbi:MAG: right-handed parallel beta-helix repeat-containing protein [Planctomycetes bacterium]|nr:right-handed parallel beta-helix repeat-containing protein [Planctomycetota bacterium]